MRLRIAVQWRAIAMASAAGCVATLDANLEGRQDHSVRTVALHNAMQPAAGGVPLSTVPANVTDGVLGAIGNTPLIELRSLSAATGCRILAKAEFMNPGGSVKDRAALNIVARLEADGALTPRHRLGPNERKGTLVEGTGGNTGVGLAIVAAARGYDAIFCMPENVSSEKVQLARTLGATVVVCPAVPFTDKRHYYHRAQQIAAETPGAVWTNQFESLMNAAGHYGGTGPEIWKQAGGIVDAFAVSAGTGGTIGGLACYLRERNPTLRVYLADPPGSALASYVQRGELVASAGTTIAEGIGIARLTRNFEAATPIDAAFTVSDQDTVDMAFYLLRQEGVFVGPSAALNVVAAVKAARQLGPGHTVVTVLCDGGRNYMTKMYGADGAWLESRGLRMPTPASIESLLQRL